MGFHLTAQEDIYCERTDFSLLSEPVNLISNISFFIAFYFLYKLYKNSPNQGLQTKTLVYLVLAIGIGSTLYHSFATTWAGLLDMIPIYAFFALFIYIFARQGLDLSIIHTLLLYVFLILLFYLAPIIFSDLNSGFVMYMPLIIFFWCLTFYLLFIEHKNAPGFVLFLLVAVPSFYLRSIDMDVCSSFSLAGHTFGTHVFWHLLNGLLLYLMGRELLIKR